MRNTYIFKLRILNKYVYYGFQLLEGDTDNSLVDRHVAACISTSNPTAVLKERVSGDMAVSVMLHRP